MVMAKEVLKDVGVAVVVFCIGQFTTGCSGSVPDAKDARLVLDRAVQVCAFRDSLPEEAKEVCVKLDGARVAVRDAAKAVLEAVPEVKPE